MSCAALYIVRLGRMSSLHAALRGPTDGLPSLVDPTVSLGWDLQR